MKLKIDENNFSFKSGVRKQILDNHNIDNEVIVSNVDEEESNVSLAEGASPLVISKILQR